jgi:predicted  nucleic acid-binding Zn-ribbon protein
MLGKDMNALIQNLVRLQALEFDEIAARNPAKTMEQLRATIPTHVLAHYDRLVARGKKGVSLVRGQVCTSCHMRVPLGTIVTILRGTDIQLCTNCGRYLYLPESLAAEATAATQPAARM